MRVLITGITGFAGSHLAEYLVNEAQVELYAVARQCERLLPALQGVVDCFEGDLRSEAFVNGVLKEARPEQIYHLAGQAFVPTAWDKPWETFEHNVRPQLNLLKGLISLELPSRLLTVTSSKVYGPAPAEEMPVKEAATLIPDSPYGLSKITADLMARQYYLSHKLDIIIARPFNHIGPRQSANFVSASFARQIAQAEAGLIPPVMQVGNLSSARDFTAVQDVVKAYALLMKQGQAGEAYNIGSGRAVPIQQILDILLSMSKIEIKVEQDQYRFRPADQTISYGDISKIQAETGWQPQISLEESLAQILAYWREQVGL